MAHAPVITAPRVCFFAHYDRDARLASYVLHYLDRLIALDIAIVFVTVVPLGEDDLATLRARCADVIVRANEGHDFGSWAAAYAKHGAGLTGDLLLANDSVYGPIGPLAPIVEAELAKGADVFGLIESIDVEPHLQSWFVWCRRDVHRSEAFRAVLGQPFAGMKKRAIIEGAEVGLTRALVAAGFTYSAAFSARDVNPIMRLRPYNPSHVLWEELIRDGRVPFLKVELLRANPLSLTDVDRWREVVAEIEPDLVAPIADHLARVGEAGPGSRTLAARMVDARRWIRRDYQARRIGAPTRMQEATTAVAYASAAVAGKITRTLGRWRRRVMSGGA